MALTFKKKKNGFTKEDLEYAKQVFEELNIKRVERFDQVIGSYASGILSRSTKKIRIK